MDKKEIEEFKKERERLNEIVMDHSDLNIRRFFNLDNRVYEEGEIPVKYKEMLGLVASTVMRCDDCIEYHMIRCKEEDVKEEEIQEVLSIALMVGGSITIPHVRKAFELWDEMEE